MNISQSVEFYLPGRQSDFPRTPPQQGISCGLNALSCVLEYLYQITPPSPEDLLHLASMHRNERDGRPLTLIGDIYDSTEFCRFIRKQFHVPCERREYKLSEILETLRYGGLAMVPFCLREDGLPCTDGKFPHWCVIGGYNDDIVPIELMATHSGKFYIFNSIDLEYSNKGIRNRREEIWYRKKGSRIDFTTNPEADHSGMSYHLSPYPSSYTLARTMLTFLP